MTARYIVTTDLPGFDSLEDAVADASKRVGPGASMPSVLTVYAAVRTVQSVNEVRVEAFPAAPIHVHVGAGSEVFANQFRGVLPVNMQAPPGEDMNMQTKSAKVVK